jgi:hypothetical protein
VSHDFQRETLLLSLKQRPQLCNYCMSVFRFLSFFASSVVLKFQILKWRLVQGLSSKLISISDLLHLLVTFLLIFTILTIMELLILLKPSVLAD